MKRSVTIIIPSRNGLDHLKENIPILLNNLDPAVKTEIIIVDNGSSDKSDAYIKANFPNIKSVNFADPLSFAEACNEGAKIAQNELLFFLNSDVRVTADFIPPLVRCFDDPEMFAVTPSIIVPRMKSINEALTSATFKGGAINTDFYASQRWKIQPDRPIPVLFGCGAALLAEKDKFRQLGGFDQMYAPFYFEDIDLSYRAQKRGWKVLCEPRSVVYHEKEATISNTYKAGRIFAIRRKNQYLFIWKNISDPTMLVSHFFELLLLKIILVNPVEWSALWQAFKQLPQALAGRRQEGKFKRVADRAIIKKAGYLLLKGEAPWRKQ